MKTLIFWVISILFVACHTEPRHFSRELPAHIPEIPWPDNQPPSVEQIALGHKLFHSKDLSSDRSLSCASCHLKEYAFADTAATSLGVHNRAGRRNSPTLYNVAWMDLFFYEGGVRTVEHATLVPMLTEDEMDMPSGTLIERLRSDPGWDSAYTGVYNADMDYPGIVRALAAFQRTLISVDAPFDQYLSSGAFPATVERGWTLFRSDSLQCGSCHKPPFFTDQDFHDLGLAVAADNPDYGRGRFTGDSADYFAFKTPTLRNVELTAPYMHDGSIPTLDSVIRLYEQGGGVRGSDALMPFTLDDRDRADLLAFLRALTGDEARKLHDQAMEN